MVYADEYLGAKRGLEFFRGKADNKLKSETLPSNEISRVLRYAGMKSERVKGIEAVHNALDRRQVVLYVQRPQGTSPDDKLGHTTIISYYTMKNGQYYYNIIDPNPSISRTGYIRNQNELMEWNALKNNPDYNFFVIQGYFKDYRPAKRQNP